ncbi:MAG: MgtC/SapB family protein [Candidatus Woesearchaeota archaeon]
MVSVPFGSRELVFLLNLLISGVAGFLIGRERESRGKDAGVATQSLVIVAAMTFTYISILVEPNNTMRIASNIIVGVGFLGAGMIMKSKGGRVTNLTTAASIWYSTAIGMSIALGWYLISVFLTAFALLVPKLPHAQPKLVQQQNNNEMQQHHYHKNWK